MFENRSLVNLALGRSSVRLRILALLLENGGARLHLREVQRRAATSPGTASRELARLVAAGLVEREPEGNQVYFRGSDSPASTLLLSLLTGAPLPTALPPAARGRYGRRNRAVGKDLASVTPPLLAPQPLTAEPAVATPIVPRSASAPPARPRADRRASLPRTDSPAPSPRPLSIDSPPTQPPESHQPTVARPRSIAAALGITPDRPARLTASPDATAGGAESPARPAASVPTVAPPAEPAESVWPATSPVVQPLPPVQETRGRLAPRPEGLDLEILIAAVKARGQVDDTAARAGATLAPNLRWLYGERLRAIFLFGDRVNGRASPESAVDLLLVLDRIERYGEELERTSLACASLSLELGVIVSRVFLSESEWQGGSLLKSLPALTGAVEL